MIAGWGFVGETAQGKSGKEGSKKVGIRKRQRLTPNVMAEVEVSEEEKRRETDAS